MSWIQKNLNTLTKENKILNKPKVVKNTCLVIGEPRLIRKAKAPEQLDRSKLKAQKHETSFKKSVK